MREGPHSPSRKTMQTSRLILDHLKSVKPKGEDGRVSRLYHERCQVSEGRFGRESRGWEEEGWAEGGVRKKRIITSTDKVAHDATTKIRQVLIYSFGELRWPVMSRIGAWDVEEREGLEKRRWKGDGEGAGKGQDVRGKLGDRLSTGTSHDVRSEVGQDELD